MNAQSLDTLNYLIAAELVPDGRDRKTSDSALIDLRYYNHLMDKVPCESLGVPLLLDSLLQQVINCYLLRIPLAALSICNLATIADRCNNKDCYI